MTRRACRLACAFLALSLLPPSSVGAQPDAMSVEARRIDNFCVGSAQARFGPFEFAGGLSLSGSAAAFGSFSAIRFRDAGSRFIGVADTGYWYSGRIARDESGRPAGIADFAMEPILGRDGAPLDGKRDSDAESLALKGDRLTVGFERAHRIVEYRLAGDWPGPALHNIDFLIPRNELRTNRGFETIAYAPDNGPLRGARVAIAERSLDKQGNVFGAVLEGPRKGIFTVSRSDEFDITDGAFLPGGDLILLERRFNMLSGISMRLRRIAADDIRPGARLDGDVLFSAGMACQIDNMEGLDIWRRDDGAVMLSLVSDDNGSFLQRTLYLEFRLVQ